jgi:hypothetical protein
MERPNIKRCKKIPIHCNALHSHLLPQHVLIARLSIVHDSAEQTVEGLLGLPQPEGQIATAIQRKRPDAWAVHSPRRSSGPRNSRCARADSPCRHASVRRVRRRSTDAGRAGRPGPAESDRVEQGEAGWSLRATCLRPPAPPTRSCTAAQPASPAGPPAPQSTAWYGGGTPAGLQVPVFRRRRSAAAALPGSSADRYGTSRRAVRWCATVGVPTDEGGSVRA